MIKHNIGHISTSISCPSNTEGETIENKIERVLNNGEPITDGAPILYMERKDGIKPEYDVRTDRFEIALEATDVIAKNKAAKRAERHEPKKSDKTEPIQGTEPPKPAA